MKNQKLIAKIKYNAWKLKSGGQIPPLLFDLICALDYDASKEDVKALSDLTLHLMRVKGYYFRFSEIELGVDKTIKEFIETRKGNH